MTITSTDTERDARDRDAADPLSSLRTRFAIPPADGGDNDESAYLAGNSLGLLSVDVRAIIDEELSAWSRWGVEGHSDAPRPWVRYHEHLREASARLVGALPHEVVVMNSLTVNLHLMLVSFYRPAGDRTAIVIEDSAFPSDSYAARSQAALHGLDPDAAVIRLRPRDGEDVLRTEDIEQFLRDEGHRVAVMMLGGVNYYTGEVVDIARVTAAGHAAGAIVGWDLAHAAGNIPLQLHEWGVDWAAWCTYKYMNAGPGAVAGCFVHERHVADRTIPRFEGWWSSNVETRFQMGPTVDPVASADAWQLSNPPILAMAPVLASLRMFDSVGITALRERSLRLSEYLMDQLDTVLQGRASHIITPREQERHGSQVSVRLGADAADVTNKLRWEHGVIGDARMPDVIRLAPVPLYNSFHDCWRAARALGSVLDELGDTQQGAS
ncbi:kynureninase [Microbacterium sp. YY-01]|uniref:kynureninase n=1 Tax=Microbacterium sp. YY-01 TaxID=3421634 RepID=UPI003D1799CB